MKYIFLLSAGHGPNTAGKRSPDGSLREFQFNHATVQYLATELKTYENVEIEFVYSPNTDTPLIQRTNAANKVYAKHIKDIKAGKTKVIYLSVHANAFGSGGWNSASGIETFVYKSKPAEAYKLAQDVQREMIKATGRKDRGVKTADFHEIRETDMTAILVECEFMTHKESNELLKSASYRQKCATAIAKGAANTFGLKKKKTPVQPKTGANTSPSVSGLYRVQAGAFKNKDGAEARAKAIKAKGIEAALIAEGGLYKVQAGAFKNKENANDRVSQLKKAGFEAALIYTK